MSVTFRLAFANNSSRKTRVLRATHVQVKTHWREDDGHLYPIIAAGNEDAEAEYEDADAEEIESIALAPKGPKDRAIID